MDSCTRYRRNREHAAACGDARSYCHFAGRPACSLAPHIQIALWSCEEQVLIGSREFRETYLARPEGNPGAPSAITRLDGYEKFSAYLNVG